MKIHITFMGSGEVMEDLAFVILAGGQSVRMGSDKAGLPFGETTLLEYQVNRFSKYFHPIYISTKRDRPQHFKGALPLYDEIENAGPLGGLHAAFSQTGSSSLVFLMAVDLPFASADLARELIKRKTPQSDICVIRRINGQIEPVFALYDKNCQRQLIHCIEKGQRSVHGMIEAARTQYVDESELTGFDLERELYNMNRPEDYLKINQDINKIDRSPG